MNNPGNIRMALEELGPSFIKIGQILSIRPDIIPASYIEEFQKLHDDVTPEKFGTIRTIIEAELGGTIDNIFKSFDAKPIACASMAEVHLAELQNGDRVVVKIQRPNARKTMLGDLAILRRLAAFLKRTPLGNILNPVEVVDELLSVVVNELDFLNEARNIKAFSENNKAVSYITCPKVYDAYSTENILVMQYIEGIKIVDVSRLDQEGYDLSDIVVKLANNYLKQIFEDGFFHGDPHPGNILIIGNKIAYIDFGMMGTLNKGLMNKLKSFIYGVATRNVNIISQAISRIGIRKGNTDFARLYTDVEQIYNSYVEESLQDIILPRMMDEILKACRKNNLAIPRDITILLKGIMTIEGVIARIAPDINVMDIALPYIKLQMLKEQDFKQEALEEAHNLLLMMKYGAKLPVKLAELMDSVAVGKFKVKLEHLNLEKGVTELHKMVNKLVSGMIVTALIIGSSLVIEKDVGIKFFNVSAIGLFGYISAFALGIWLLMSVMRSGRM